jgi:acetylglutamate kinase
MVESEHSLKASTLVEAMQYISKFKGKTFVIKCGGEIVEDKGAMNYIVEDIVTLSLLGIKPVVVHGGSKRIDKFLKDAGIESRYKGGLRVTDDRTMEIVEMVLMGSIQREIVSKICSRGGRAIGIAGTDSNMLRAKQDKSLGRVGHIHNVDTSVLSSLIEKGFIPVISPITISDDGISLNTNADEAAAKIAIAAQVEKLIILTDVDGVLDTKGSLIKTLYASDATKLVKDGVIKGGMKPKVEFGIEAVKNNVKKVHIINGQLRHSILLEIFTEEGIGTEVK